MRQYKDYACITTADLVARSAYQMGKTPLLPIFAASIGATGAYLGLIVSVSTLTGMLLKPLIGALSDRWGRRTWLIVGTSFFVVMPFFYQFVHTAEHLFVIRLVHGSATAIYGPVTIAYVADQTYKRRAERIGWFGMARSMGYIIGPMTAGWLLLFVEPVQVFSIIGLLSSAVFLPILLLPKQHCSIKKHRVPIHHQLSKALKASSATPSIWLSGGLNALMFIALYTVKTFLPIYALSAGFSVVSVGLFFSVQEAVHMLFKPVGGRIGDRNGYLLAITLGMILLGLTLPLLTLPNSGISLLFLSGVIGIAQALVFPSKLALVATQISTNY